MAKSPAGTTSTRNGKGAAGGSTAGSSKNSAPSGKPPTSKGHLPDEDLLLIFAADLARLQERFGDVHLVKGTDPGDPVLVVLPLTLDLGGEGKVVIRENSSPVPGSGA